MLIEGPFYSKKYGRNFAVASPGRGRRSVKMCGSGLAGPGDLEIIGVELRQFSSIFRSINRSPNSGKPLQCHRWGGAGSNNNDNKKQSVAVCKVGQTRNSQQNIVSNIQIGRWNGKVDHHCTWQLLGDCLLLCKYYPASVLTFLTGLRTSFSGVTTGLKNV